MKSSKAKSKRTFLKSLLIYAPIFLLAVNLKNADAVTLKAMECLSWGDSECITQVNQKEFSGWLIPDFLGHNSNDQNVLNFQDRKYQKRKFKRNAELLDTLDEGLELKKANVQKQIADKLHKFSEYCNLDQMTLKIIISKIPRLVGAPNVTNPRRISRLAIAGCFAKIPPECNYSAANDDISETGLGLGNLISFLNLCYARVAEISNNEKERAEYQAIHNPNGR